MEADLNCVPPCFPSLEQGVSVTCSLEIRKDSENSVRLWILFFWFYGRKVMKVLWFDRVLCEEVYEKQRWERG